LRVEFGNGQSPFTWGTPEASVRDRFRSQTCSAAHRGRGGCFSSNTPRIHGRGRPNWLLVHARAPSITTGFRGGRSAEGEAPKILARERRGGCLRDRPRPEAGWTGIASSTTMRGGQASGGANTIFVFELGAALRVCPPRRTSTAGRCARRQARPIGETMGSICCSLPVGRAGPTIGAEQGPGPAIVGRLAPRRGGLPMHYRTQSHSASWKGDGRCVPRRRSGHSRVPAR